MPQNSSQPAPQSSPASTEVVQQLRAACQAADSSGEITVSEGAFKDLTTLRLGGPAAAVVTCRSIAAVQTAVRVLDAQQLPWLPVGGGSNLVVGDASDHVVLLLRPNTQWDSADPDTLTITSGPTDDSVTVQAFAGVNWDDFVATTINAGYGGLECLSGIPGCVGATPVQNVGAYGVEVSQVLTRVLLTYRRSPAQNEGDGSQHSTQSGTQEWVAASELDLRYRYSNLKFTSRAVVTAVEFELRTDGLSMPLRYGQLTHVLGVADPEPGAQPQRLPAAKVRDAVLDLRSSKGMVWDEEDPDTWSAGSFFTNPIIPRAQLSEVQQRVVEHCGNEVAEAMPHYPGGEESVKLSAAWLIDHAGMSKGWAAKEGALATLSTKHTLALTNRGGAQISDLVELAQAVRTNVKNAFGVVLEPEPVWLGAQLPRI